MLAPLWRAAAGTVAGEERLNAEKAEEAMMKSLKFAVLALLLLAAPAFGASVVLTGAGQTWSLYYNGIVDINGTATVVQGLSARVDYNLTGLSYDAGSNITYLNMDIVISNTSDAAIWQKATLGGVAFDTDPNAIKMGSAATGAFGYIAFNKVLPGSTGFGVEICASGYQNSCDTNYQFGVDIGATGTSSLQLAFMGNVLNSPITLSAFAVRWSDLLSGQYGFLLPVTGNGYGVPVTPPIPEPSAAAVFALGAVALAAALRKRVI
jgi:hypothetical protein